MQGLRRMREDLPGEIYKIENDRVIVGNSADCSGCQSCVSVCENQAINISEI